MDRLAGHARMRPKSGTSIVPGECNSSCGTRYQWTNTRELPSNAELVISGRSWRDKISQAGRTGGCALLWVSDGTPPPLSINLAGLLTAWATRKPYLRTPEMRGSSPADPIFQSPTSDTSGKNRVSLAGKSTAWATRKPYSRTPEMRRSYLFHLPKSTRLPTT